MTPKAEQRTPPPGNGAAHHETVLEVGTQRLARIYAEALFRAAEKQKQTNEILEELQALTGQVFRAVGSTIARYQPWTLQEELENPRGVEQWDPNDIGPVVNARVFHSRNPGLQMGAMRKSTR